MDLVYHGLTAKIEKEYIAATTTGYTLPTGVYQVGDIFPKIESLLPRDILLESTIDGIRKKTSLTFRDTINFTEKLVSTQYQALPDRYRMGLSKSSL